MNNIKDTAYNIVSKLDFKTLDNNSVIVDTFKDENVPSIFTWDVSDKSNISVSESNGVKVITVKSNNAGIYAQANKYNNPIFPNFKNADFELEIELEIENVNAENIYFGVVGTNNAVLLFNFTNKTIGGFELFSSGRHVKFNYKFESKVKYNVMVTRNSNRYTLYVNGLCVGTSLDATAFNNNINVNDIPTFTIAKAQPASNDNSQFKGKYYGINLSVYGTKYNRSFTKYGANLVSRYNFEQFEWDNASTTTKSEIEAVYNAPFKWTLDIPITSSTGAWHTNKSIFSSYIKDIFTIQFEVDNQQKSKIDLVDFGTYKVQYELIKIGEPEPQVIVNQFTKSAIDFENGGIDKITSTVWNYGSNTRIQSTNTIFGESCLEILDVTGENLINSTVDTTAFLLGSQRPYTIEFYAVIKGKMGAGDHALFSQSENAGGGEQYITVGNGFKTRYTRERAHSSYPMSTKAISPDSVRYNEINKFTMTYDRSAIRLFVNDKLQQLSGSVYGWNFTGQRFWLMNSLVPSFANYQFTTIGLMDNVNVFDNEVRMVREYDEFEEFLVCDLQFDGYGGTRNFIDNAPPKPIWENDGSGFQLADDVNDTNFNTGISYFQKTSYINSGIKSNNVDMNFDNNIDFTLSFEVIKSVDNTYCNFLSSGVTNYQDQTQYPKLAYVGLFGSSYTGIAPLSRKISFFNEKYLEENRQAFLNNPLKFPNVLVSNRIIEIGTRYKIDMVRKSGYMYLYINNELDNVIEFSRDINLSPTGLGMAIGYVPFSNEAGLVGGLNYVKAYKGVAIFPNTDNNKLSLNFDKNLQDQYDYYKTKTWTNNNNVTYVDDVNSINGSATQYTDSLNQYISSGKNDKLNYGNGNFDISFDVKNTNPNNSSRLEVVVASGETSFTPNNTDIQVVGFHYQSNDTGSTTIKTDLRSRIMFGFNLNNTDYLQTVKVIRDTYYKINQLRIGNTFVQKINDVTCNISNYNLNIPFNLNKSDNTYIGKCLWRGSSPDAYINPQFTGYIDNFKSIKDDLTYGISKFSNSTNSRIENKNNYLSIAPFMLDKYAVAQLDDSPSINRGIIEVDFFVHKDRGTLFSISLESFGFDNIKNDTYGYLFNIERDSSDVITTGCFRGSQDGSTSSMINFVRGVNLASGTICKIKITITDRIEFKINDVMIHDIARDVVKKVPIAFRNWMSSGMTSNPNTEVLIKSVKMSNLNGEEIYYRDWNTSIVNTIDRPVIDSPFNKHSIHYGTSSITIDNYNSGAGFANFFGRECAKFSNNRSLQINNPSDNMDNPLNFGSKTDFYIELDFLIENEDALKTRYHSILCDRQTDTNMLGGQLAVGDANDATYSSKLYFRKLKDENISLISKNKILFGSWNNMKFYRKDNIVYLDLNGDVVSTSFKNVDFSSGGTHIGRAGFNPSAWFEGYMSNLVIFSGRSDKPSNYNSKEVLHIDFEPTRKSYLFKDNYNKHVIHPTNITKREYINSMYGVRLNGTDQNLQLGKSSMLNFATNSDFIMQIKFNYDTNNPNVNGAVLIACANTGWTTGSLYLVIGFGDNLNKITCGMYGYADTFSTSNLINNGYNELVLYKENGILKMLLNGQISIHSGTFNDAYLDFNKNNNTFIGRSGWSTTDNFKGVIHEIKVLRETSDLSLLDEEGTRIEENFIITNGNPDDDKNLKFDAIKPHKIKITSDENKLLVAVDENILEVPKDNSINSVKLFDGYKGKIKDLRVYDVAFTDEDVYVGTEWINTVMPEIEITDDVEELEIYDIGDYKVKGFIEGYLDRKFQIYNNNYNYVVYSGIEDYDFETDENSIDNIEVHDLVNGQKYPLYTHEMIKGFIGGTVNLDSCGVKGDEMKVYCFRSDNNRFIGVYDINTIGKYEIPNLDVNSRYDIVFKTIDRKLENISSSYRQPKKY